MKTTKIKKLVAALLAAAMLAGMFSMYAYAANGSETPETSHKVEFTDVTPDKWYYEAVMAMADAGAVNGYGNGKFGPNDPVTYGQFFLIIMRLCWPEAYKDGDLTATAEGLDAYVRAMLLASVYLRAGMFAQSSQVYAVKDGQLVPANEWWKGTIFEQEYGPIPDQWKDVTPNTYKNTPVQRGQAMTYLANIARFKNLYTAVNDVSEADIPDWNIIAANDIFTVYGSRDNGSIAIRLGVPTLRKEAVLKAYQYGIVQGTDSNMTCNPLGTVTRAQFCQMLYNMGLTSPRYGTIRLH